MTCQLYEARRTARTDLSKFLEKITEIDPTCGLAQTCEINNTLPDNSIPTRFGYSPPGSFGSYQLAFSESNFKVTTSFKSGSGKQSDSGSLPKFPSLPVDDFNDNFIMNIPKDLNQQQEELLDGFKLSLVQANELEEKTRLQYKSEAWLKQRKLRFTVSKFGRVSRRQKNFEKFLQRHDEC